MKKIGIFFSLCLGILLQGCVTTLPVAYSPYPGVTPLSDISRKTFKVAEVEDVRAEKKVVGYAMNALGMKIKDFVLGEDMKGMLKKSVEDMLEKDGHRLGQGEYEIKMKLKELWTVQSTHFATLEFNTRMNVEVSLQKGTKELYKKDVKARTSSKSAIMGKEKVGRTFSNVIIEFIKELSRDSDFIESIS